ncbi:MFS transporter [Mycetohabitans sp. B5]|uniref:MFS transporter n=1 Tax=Mycetohabitans endofungorum TaxID=417203 RepID=A0A2P5KCJ5_9BURK|nr:MFS transporter [Mycetohabitans sp. B5]PPB84444.1 MFS transporter [Mycetohabitans endofungorum]
MPESPPAQSDALLHRLDYIEAAANRLKMPLAFADQFYASRHWPHAALSLTVFGTLFCGARLLFSSAIKKHGGFRVAIASLLIKARGLLTLWLAPIPQVALAGAALTGLGFALVFPALGAEAVALAPPANRGAALSAYSVFLDLSLGLTGPLAGLIAGDFGYESVYLFAAVAACVAAVLSIVWARRQNRLGHFAALSEQLRGTPAPSRQQKTNSNQYRKNFSNWHEYRN